MSDQPNISQILAALAQDPGAAAAQTALPVANSLPQRALSGQNAPSYPPSYSPSGQSTPHVAGSSAYNLPQPIGSGSINLQSIKPVKSGSVNMQDAVIRDNYRDRSPPSRNRRSRSRSPLRGVRGSYGYHDERYEDSRHPIDAHYGHERRFSPDLRGPVTGTRYATPPSQNYGPISGADPDSEVIPVVSKVVGLIIGRRGENLKRVETDTGTKVQFVTGPQESSPMRQCRISGPKHAREAAKEEIYRIIEENGNPSGNAPSSRSPLPGTHDVGVSAKASASNQPALRTGEESTQILVPNRTVGLIIGRGGETIRDLQDRSGCHVNIVGEDKSINGLRPVNLIGTPSTSAFAKDLIMEIVDSDTKSQTSQSNTTRDSQQMPAHGAGSGEKVSDQIFVPSEAVGMIIGKGGDTIKNMQNETGCKINVSPASGRDVEREIGLIGTKFAVEKAKNAIMEKVHAVQEKNARSSAGANTGQFMSQSNQTSNGQQVTQNHSTNSAQTSGGIDPYAAYGGYDNYVAMWYASQMQKTQQQNSQGPQGS